MAAPISERRLFLFLLLLFLSAFVQGALSSSFFSGDFEPFPVCQAKYSAPCSHTNIRTVVSYTKEMFEAAADVLEIHGLLDSINARTFDNTADGFGFGPLILRYDNGAVLADAENPELSNTSLSDILEFDSSGCDKDVFDPQTCYQPSMTIIQQDLIDRMREAADSGDGLVSWVWTRRDAEIVRGKKKPDQRIGFVRKAATLAGDLLVTSSFSDQPLPLPQPSCSAANNEICSIEFSRRLVGDALVKMTMAESHSRLESVLHDITYHNDMYKLPTGFYIFVYRFGAAGEPGEHGECAAHGARSDFIGKNLPEILSFVGNRAVDGWALHTSFLEAALNGGGWVDYAWKNTVEQDPFYKIAFIAGTHRFGVKYYLGVGFTHEHPPVQQAPHCTGCSAGSNYPCAIRNTYLLISHTQSLLLTNVAESDAWSQLTAEKNSDGFGQVSSAGYSFEGGFYNFAYDFNGTCVAHGARGDFVGLTLWGILATVGLNQGCDAELKNCAVTAVDGVALNNAFVIAAKDGGGWARYDWRNSASEPSYNKVAYLVKLSKYGREFYVGVGYNDKPWLGPPGAAENCSATFNGACSEDNVLAVVGTLAASISNAQSRNALEDVLFTASHGLQGDLGPYKRPGGFFVEAYDEDNNCVAHGGQASNIGKSLDELFLAIGSKRISPGQFTERYRGAAPVGGWFNYDWQTAEMDWPEKRKAFALKVDYSPLGSAVRESYYIIGSFAEISAPARCEHGCPENSQCAAESRCQCEDGYRVSFSPSEEPCGEAFDYPMTCINVRGKECRNFDNGTLFCGPCPDGYYCPQGNKLLCPLGKYCPEGSEEPKLCIDGLVTLNSGASSDSSCQACAAGTAWSRQLSLAPASLASCIQCSAGKYTARPGDSECLACPRGAFNAELGSDSCQTCLAGFFAAEASMTECGACPKGEFSEAVGTSECSRCPQGTFAGNLSQRECTKCPLEGTNTRGVGARSEDECVCESGSYMGLDGGCVACPERMICEAGSSEAVLMDVVAGRLAGVDGAGEPQPYPKVEAKYWTSTDAPLSVFRCTDELHCPGGDPRSCATNAIGQACALCKDEHYWDGSKCVECSEPEKSQFLFPVLPGFLIFLVILVMYRLSRDTYDKWNSWQNCCIALGFIALNHYQLISLLRTVNLQLPSLVADVFLFWSFSEDVLSIFNLECAGFASFTVNMVLKSLSPIGLLLACIVLYTVSQLLARFAGKNDFALDFNRLWNVFFSLVFTFFNGISALSMSLFKCGSNPNSKLTLSKDPSINCFEDEWNNLIVVGILAFFTYCVLCGLVFAWAIRSATSGRFVDESFRMRWKFLFIKFRPDVHWWAIILLLRGVGINAGFIIFTNGLEQLCWIMVVETLYILLTVFFHPWRMRNANYLSLVTSFSILYACSLNAIYVEDDIDHFWVAQMTFTITLVPVLATMLFTAITIRTALQDQTSRSACTRSALETIANVSRAFAEIETTRLEELYNSVGQWDRWYLEKFTEVVESEFLNQRCSSRTLVNLCSRENAKNGITPEPKVSHAIEASTQCEAEPQKELYLTSKPCMMELEKQRHPPMVPFFFRQESSHKVFTGSSMAKRGGVTKKRKVEMPKN